MRVIRTPHYILRLQKILEYIGKDKISAAKKFKASVDKNINTLVHSPYKYRKSFYFNDENIRDMIFEGYSIIYRVDRDKNIIEILEIFNQNLPEIK
ncbi:MAG: type II toxin-antitoxin system RelE/ParE family toxin [Arcobacteraceae bacterium]|jgi:plasmid stabilization system protein ParE|nr:type II toxin-antitoxin system RelE/ParE family toxin [Arcobacteraceae bacterium]